MTTTSDVQTNSEVVDFCGGFITINSGRRKRTYDDNTTDAR